MILVTVLILGLTALIDFKLSATKATACVYNGWLGLLNNCNWPSKKSNLFSSFLCICLMLYFLFLDSP